MGFVIAVESPVHGAEEQERKRHSLPPLFANFLKQREAAIFQRIDNAWKERAKGQDWPSDWVAERIKEDFEKEVAAKRPHLRHRSAASEATAFTVMATSTPSSLAAAASRLRVLRGLKPLTPIGLQGYQTSHPRTQWNKTDREYSQFH